VPVGSDRFQVTIGFNGVALIVGNVGWGLLSTVAANTTSNDYGYPPLGVSVILVLLGLVDTAYIGTLIGRRADRRRPPDTRDGRPPRHGQQRTPQLKALSARMSCVRAMSGCLRRRPS